MTGPSAAPVEEPELARRTRKRRAIAQLVGLAVFALVAWWSPWTAPEHELPTGAASVDAGVPDAAKLAVAGLHGARFVEGLVQDDRGEPLAAALVHVTSSSAPTLPAREVLSDAQGHFRVDNLPAELLSLEVTLAGHEGKEHTLQAQDQGKLTFVLARQGELRVTLRDSPGQAVDATEVVVTGPGLWPAQAGRSDDKGETVFKGLPAGDYRVRARRGVRIALPAETVSVVPGKRTETELTLIAGAALSGVVLDQQSKKPVPGARVSIQDLTPGIDALSVVADKSGAFAAYGLWPGPVRVDAQHEGYASSSRDLTLPHAERLELSLAGAAALSGVVVDEAGKPIQGARLSVSTSEGLPIELNGDGQRKAGEPGVGELGVTSGPIPELPLIESSEFALGTLAAESDSAGAFRIAQLAPVALALHIVHPGYVPERVVISELTPHAEKSGLKIVLREAGRVVGRVVDARGRALSSVYVAARAGDREQSALTNGSGEYTLRDLLGEVLVEAQPDGRTTLRCKVVVRARSEARCDLTADTAVHELRVRVVDEYGIGLEGAQVTVVSSSPPPKASVDSGFVAAPTGLTSLGPGPTTQLTRHDGTALLRGLTAPPYLVDVTLVGQLAVHDLPVATVEAEVRVALARAATLGGFVVDVLGRAVPGAFVSTVEGETSDETDALGTFTLEGVSAGTQSLLAHHARAGDGRSSEVRARPSERLDGVRIVLSGRLSADDLADGGTAARETSAPKPALVLEQRGRVLVVTQVVSPGPAARAGLRSGDVISAIDGEVPLSAAHARGMLRTPAGRTAVVRVLRNKHPVNLQYRRPAL
ncbi:MAG: hypothetical protein RLZZ450_4251 [Pseudomonadota bacterium]|jgi:hypothetical protein